MGGPPPSAFWHRDKVHLMDEVKMMMSSNSATLPIAEATTWVAQHIYLQESNTMSVLPSKVQILSGTSVANSPRVSRGAVRPQVRRIQALARRATPRSSLFSTSSPQRQAVIVRAKPVPKGLGQAKWEEELEAGRDLSVVRINALLSHCACYSHRAIVRKQ